MLWAEVNLSKLAGNINLIKKRIGDEVKIIFVAKVDGYGHGLEETARVARKADLDYLAVANLNEAERLRDEGIGLPILIFGPIPLQEDTVDNIIRLNVTPTITSTNFKFLQELDRKSRLKGVTTKIHLNVDTGMGRTGLVPDKVIRFTKEVREFDSIQLEGIYSHLSVAESDDTKDRKYTLRQIGEFNRILGKLENENLLPSLRHIANSAGLLQYPERVAKDPFNAVRVGTLFYGYPEVERTWVEDLDPVFSLFTRIAEVRTLSPGSYVSYGRKYKVESEKSIGVLPVGYGQGLNRKLANSGRVSIQNKKVPVVGEVCANHTMVDVTEIDNVAPGDKVELMGEKIPVNQLGKRIGAGILELLSPFATQDLTRRYKKDINISN